MRAHYAAGAPLVMAMAAIAACSPARSAPAAPTAPVVIGAMPPAGGAPSGTPSRDAVFTHHTSNVPPPVVPSDAEAPAAWFATPRGWKGFKLWAVTGTEEVGPSAEFRVRVQILDPSIEGDSLLGTLATAALKTAEEMVYITGYVSEIEHVADAGLVSGERGRTYELTLVPWTHLLSKAASSAILPARTAPSALEQLFSARIFGAYSMKLTRKYPESRFVQYRETDLNLARRLIEHAGLLAYFRHGPIGHTLVLLDNVADYGIGTARVELQPRNAEPPVRVSRLATSRYVVRASRPDAAAEVVEGSAAVAAPPGIAGLEIYDFEGVASTPADAAFYAQVRAEEQQSSAGIVHIRAQARAVRCGSVVTIKDFGSDVNGDYLVVRAGLRANIGDGTPSLPTVETAIEAVSTAHPYRPPRKTPWPVINGAQVARVVRVESPSGARVRVRFAWARGEPDAGELSVPVARGRALSPGDLVLVEFLEGDPSRPVVIGSAP